MQMKDKIDFIDEFLATCEDWMHGKEGDDVTKCRKYLDEISTEFKKMRVGDVSMSICKVCQKELLKDIVKGDENIGLYDAK